MSGRSLPVIGRQNVLKNKIRLEPITDAEIGINVRVKIFCSSVRFENAVGIRDSSETVGEKGFVGDARIGQRQNGRAGENIAPNISLHGGVK